MKPTKGVAAFMLFASTGSIAAEPAPKQVDVSLVVSPLTLHEPVAIDATMKNHPAQSWKLHHPTP